MAKKKKDAETTVTLAVKDADGQNREVTLPASKFDERLESLTKKAGDQFRDATEMVDPTAPPRAEWEHLQVDEQNWPGYLRAGAEQALFENLHIRALDVVDLRRPIGCPDHISEGISRSYKWLVLDASPLTTEDKQDLAVMPLDFADRPEAGLIRAYLVSSDDVEPVVGRVARNRKRAALEDFCRMRRAWTAAGSICHPTEAERSRYLVDGVARSKAYHAAQAEADSLRAEAKDAQKEADAANADALRLQCWALDGRPWPYRNAPAN